MVLVGLVVYTRVRAIVILTFAHVVDEVESVSRADTLDVKAVASDEIVDVVVRRPDTSLFVASILLLESLMELDSEELCCAVNAALPMI